jgi:hypothetical protein
MELPDGHLNESFSINTNLVANRLLLKKKIILMQAHLYYAPF